MDSKPNFKSKVSERDPMVYATPTLTGQNSFSMKVDLFISGRNLKDLDLLSKSDPICILSEYNDQTKQWVKLGQTEQI